MGKESGAIQSRESNRVQNHPTINAEENVSRETPPVKQSSGVRSMGEESGTIQNRKFNRVQNHPTINAEENASRET